MQQPRSNVLEGEGGRRRREAEVEGGGKGQEDKRLVCDGEKSGLYFVVCRAVLTTTKELKKKVD